MTIAFASDHRGYPLKQELIKLLEKEYNIIDLGTTNTDITDAPKYGISLGETIRDNKADLGIGICGTGIGISISANKVKQVMCAKVNNVREARLAKEHNQANVLALPGTLSKEEALAIIKEFLKASPLKEERYQRRINQIINYENVS